MRKKEVIKTLRIMLKMERNKKVVVKAEKKNNEIKINESLFAIKIKNNNFKIINNIFY